MLNLRKGYVPCYYITHVINRYATFKKFEKCSCDPDDLKGSRAIVSQGRGGRYRRVFTGRGEKDTEGPPKREAICFPTTHQVSLPPAGHVTNHVTPGAPVA